MVDRANSCQSDYIDLSTSISQRSEQPQFIKKIISGGQTGADRAALDWAIQHHIEHGGWCPQGRWAEDGPIDSKYHLRETASSLYAQRTEWNVRDTDATVIFTLTPQLAGGCLWTLSSAKKYQKPWLHLVSLVDGSRSCMQLLEFLQKYPINVLNIAGSRESEESDIGNFVSSTLEQVYQQFRA